MGKLNKSNTSKPFRRAEQQPSKSKMNLKQHQQPLKKVVTSDGKVSKKAKRLLKKTEFVAKLSASNDAKEKLKKTKLKSQTVIVGNMEPLFDALTDIVQQAGSVNKKKKSVKVVNGKKKISSEKTRIKADMNDIDLFQKVASHEKFIENPMLAIADHIKYMLEKENQE